MITNTNPDNPKYDIDYARKVMVYKNLHKDGWSIKQDGLVKGWADSLFLNSCVFKVSKKGRDRVIAEGRKNVHAFVTGYLSRRSDGINLDELIPITYNPYKYSSFVTLEDKVAVYKSDFVSFGLNVVHALN